ncbi:MAG: integrase [Actinobacteria bacterium]|nr:MAG: integrase [Actinomycetota bacterium]
MSSRTDPPELPSWRDVPVTLGSDGRYHAKVTVGRRADGRLDRRHRSGKTEAEVRRKLRELLREVEAGRKPRVGRVPTVEQWFAVWLTDIAPRGATALARRTLDDYWSRCRNWIFPYLGAIRLDALEPEDLDRLYAAMYAAGSSEGHVLKTHAVIRRGLEIALRRGRVARNVAKLIDPPGAPRVARESLTREEIAAILKVAARRRSGARWALGLAIGTRQGETLGLRWADVDLDAGTVTIQWQLQRLTWRHGCDDPYACAARPRRHRPHGLHRPDCPPDCARHAATCPQRTGGGLVFTRPKGWRRRPRPRVVALPGSLVQMLREHRARQAAERLAAGSWWQDYDLVFCQPNGRPIDPRADYGEWQDILREAGVPPARVHVMRHSTATTLLDLGVDISIVQEVLGHADIRTTRGYLDVGVEMTRRAAASWDRLLSGSVTDLVTERRRRRST